MEISITAVTRNRKFTKSLIKHAQALAPLRRLAAGADTRSLPFDVLQLVFVDRSENYVNAVGCKGDRLFQVKVSIPSEKSVDFGNPSEFVARIAHQLNVAVKLCGLPKDVESQLAGVIRSFEVD